MRRFLFVFSVLLLGACSFIFGNFKEIGNEEFEQLSEQNETVILDVRTLSEYSEGHIPNALNIDYLDEGFEHEISLLDTSATYLVYCRSGSRSYNACSKMDKAGFKHIYSLKNGFLGWDGEKVND